MKPESEKIVDVAAGSGDPLEALYRARRAHFIGLAHWVVGDRGLAEEIVQDTFIRLVERPPMLHERDSLDAYVRAAMMNRCRSKIRRLVLERKHSSSVAEPSVGEPDDSGEGIRAALLRLPMRQRQCVVLRFYDDLTVDQIAHALDIGAGSVKTHLHRGLKALEIALGEGSSS